MELLLVRFITKYKGEWSSLINHLPSYLGSHGWMNNHDSQVKLANRVKGF